MCTFTKRNLDGPDYINAPTSRWFGASRYARDFETCSLGDAVEDRLQKTH